MSIPINSTTNKNGILQTIEQRLGFTDGFITGNAARLLIWTNYVNRSMDKIWQIIYEVAYGWNPDDTNHTHYPIQFFNLVDGQREYSFTADEDGNLVTDILKLAVKDANGVFHEIPVIDQQSRQGTNNDVSAFLDGQNVEGTPVRYDKTATGIFLDPIPSYNSTNGAKIFLEREPYYFTSSDVSTGTKKPGFSPLYHMYCVVEPCYQYALANTLASREAFFRDMLSIENAVRKDYGRRDRDMIRRLQVVNENMR